MHSRDVVSNPSMSNIYDGTHPQSHTQNLDSKMEARSKEKNKQAAIMAYREGLSGHNWPITLIIVKNNPQSIS